MSVQIHNSLSKRKEKFVPLDGKTVKMYCCGVTVYDKCHIGHARSLYIFEFVRRYLKVRGYDVQFVRNITDIDDKIIQKANDCGQTSEEVSEANIKDYYNDLKRLEIDEADQEPKATDNIEGMIKHIEGLIEKDFAYAVDGDVYFNIKRFKEYGKLSGQSVDHMLEGVRIDVESKKKYPLDFTLWKKSKDGEPHWDSPWGSGRPGWHIECSCMSMKHLNTETLDIHAGGRDLIFPHHENEIAQSECLTGKPFAKYWMHHGLLTIEGQKMAKSSVNFITIEDAVEKYGADELKLFFLSSHYSSPINFSEKSIHTAKKHILNFKEYFDKVHTWRVHEGKNKIETSEKDKKKIEVLVQEFYNAMDDDFNTPQAVAAMFGLVDLGSKFISSDKEDAFRDVYDRLKECFQVFGLKVKEKINVDHDLLGLLKKREGARSSKDFSLADELRDQILKEFHVNIVDTIGGVALIEGGQ